MLYRGPQSPSCAGTRHVLRGGRCGFLKLVCGCGSSRGGGGRRPGTWAAGSGGGPAAEPLASGTSGWHSMQRNSPMARGQSCTLLGQGLGSPDCEVERSRPQAGRPHRSWKLAGSNSAAAPKRKARIDCGARIGRQREASKAVSRGGFIHPPSPVASSPPRLPPDTQASGFFFPQPWGPAQRERPRGSWPCCVARPWWSLVGAGAWCARWRCLGGPHPSASHRPCPCRRRRFSRLRVEPLAPKYICN